MGEIEIIYKEGTECINNIWNYIHKAGVWALFGQKDGQYECLNVGKSVDVGYEVLYDISCLHNLEVKKKGTKLYINQFGEDCEFYYDDGLTQEYLYPHINHKYKKIIFVQVYHKSDRGVEKVLAWLTHAKYWRNGKPFEKSKEDGYYSNHIKEIIGNKSYKGSWKTEDEIIEYLKNIQWK